MPARHLLSSCGLDPPPSQPGNDAQITPGAATRMRSNARAPTRANGEAGGSKGEKAAADTKQAATSTPPAPCLCARLHERAIDPGETIQQRQSHATRHGMRAYTSAPSTHDDTAQPSGRARLLTCVSRPKQQATRTVRAHPDPEQLTGKH